VIGVGWGRFLRRRRWDEERARELRSYVEIETDENVARGLSPEAARRAAERKLGSELRVREEIYLMNSVRFLDHLWQDLGYGLRSLRLHPGFAVVAVSSLALGVGANSAVFQLLNGIRLRGLPVRDPASLVEVRIANRQLATGAFTGRYPQLSNPQWELIRERAEGFSSLGAWGAARFDLASGGEVRPAEGMWVSGGFFEALGVRPALGRLPSRAEDRRACEAPGVVVSHAFWMRELGGRPGAVGDTLRLDGHPFPIVGVAAAGFFGVEVGRSFDVAVPLCAEPIVRGASSGLDKSDVWFLGTVGRLKPGWSLERATAQLAAISPAIFRETVSPRYSKEDAERYQRFSLAVFPFRTGVSTLRRDYEKPLWVLLALTGLVLLVACANLANLMLARASAREREIAVRLAIGASRGRVVRQLTAESMLVAVLGTAAGAWLATVLSGALVAFLSPAPARLALDLSPDPRVFAFTAAIATLTCALFGLVPALRATRVAPASALKSGGRGATAARGRFGLNRLLVVAQVALSLVLGVGALLFAGTLRNLVTLDLGFSPDTILVASLDLRRAGFPPGQRLAVYDTVVDAVAAVPGVLHAARADVVPVSGSVWNETILVGGEAQKDYPSFNRVGPGFFRAMQTPLVKGRDFDERDDRSAPPVAIVNESFVRRYLGGGDPLGRTFEVQAPQGEPGRSYQVVGVVGDTKYVSLRDPLGPIAYLAGAQDPEPDGSLQLVVRTAGPPASVEADVVRAVAGVQPRIPIRVDTMRAQVFRSTLSERLMATLASFFGALAGVIAAIGLYGVLSYIVARRRNEIGIRIALGAGRAAVVGMVLRESSVLLGAGIAVGAVLAVAAGRMAEALLFGLRPADPAALAQAASALGAVALLASVLPALRAARIEPTRALRED
jgi:predicted permease